MTLNIISSGVNTSFSSDLNENNSEVFSLIGKEHIRTLFDRSIVYSVDFTDGWGEAYTTIKGRNNSVNVDSSSTTSAFITVGDTATDANTVEYSCSGDIDVTGTNTSADTTNVDNAFDGDDTTYAYCNTSRGDNTFASYIGRTFTSQYVSFAKVNIWLDAYDSSGSENYVDARLESYNGSTWSVVYTFPIEPDSSSRRGIHWDGWVEVDDTVEGLRIAYNVRNQADHTPSSSPTSSDNSCSGIFYSLEWTGTTTGGSTITHALPSGTFSGTISSSIATAVVASWESGANIQYKLTNSSQDTGWLNINEVSNFSPFTTQPDKLIVRLVPKSSSPTLGVPSIKGFWVRAS